MTCSTSPPSNHSAGSPSHVHLALRGTISRADLREVIAATYHQVWWPSTETAKYDGGCLPVWDEHARTYLDPDTGRGAANLGPSP